MIHHTGILDDLNNFIAKFSLTFGAAVTVIVLVVILIVAVKVRFAFATTAITVLSGAFVIWLVNFGGLAWFAHGIAGETNGQGVTTSVVETEI